MEARNLRGSLYMLRCQYNEALADFNFILNNSAVSESTLNENQNGNNSSENGDEQNLETTNSSRRDRLKSNTLIKLTALNLQNNQETEAFENYAKAIEIDPTNEDIYCNRAQVFAMKGRYEDSFQDFDKCLGERLFKIKNIFKKIYLKV